MTKTNKTLLCVLLALVMTFALALTALTVADTQTAKADDTVLTLEFSADNRVTNASTNTWSANGITFTNSTSNTYNAPARIYTDNTFTIECENMTKIVFNCNSSSYATVLAKSTVGGATGTVSNKTVTYEFSTQTNSVTSTSMTAQTRFDSIDVYVSSSTGGEVEEGTVAVTVNGKAMATDGTGRYFELPNKARITIDSVTLKQGDAYILTLAEGAGYAGAGVTTANYIVKVNGEEVEFDGNEALGQAAADATTLAITFECRHNTTKEIAKKEATCTEAGYEASWECDECGTLFDSAEKTTVIEAATVIPALGHEYSNGTCTRCGAEEPAGFELLTDISKLKAGDKIVFVGKKGTEPYVSSTKDSGGKYLQAVSSGLTIEGNTITSEIPESDQITLEGEAGAWKLKIGGEYIKGNNDLSFGTSEGLWTISCDEEGKALIYVQGSTTNRIAFNSSAPRFKTYTNNTYEVYIYVQAAASEPACIHEHKEEHKLIPATTTTTGTKAYFHCNDCGKNFVYNEDGVTYTEASEEDLILPTVTLVQITEEITVEEGSAKAKLADGTIYIAEGGKIYVTYSITDNSGINALQFTLRYNANLFKVTKITANTELGESIVVTGNEVENNGVYKVILEGLGDGYQETYTGVLVTVEYTYIAKASDVTSLEGLDTTFGINDMQATKSSTDGSIADITVKPVTSDIKFDLIKTAEITLNNVAAGGTVNVTYNAKALTVNLELNNPSLIVRSDNTGKIVTTWYSDSARQNKIDAPTIVGTYYLTVVIESNGQYAESTADFTIVIEQYEIDYDALQVIASPNNKALSDGTATWADNEITIEGLSDLPDQTGVYTVTYGTKSFDTVGDHTITVKAVIINANYKFVPKDGFATGDSATEYNGGVEVSVSAKAIDLVLPELADKYYDAQPISLAGITASVEGEELEVSIEIKVNDVVVTSENIASYIVNAGSYKISVRAWIEGNANYKEVTGSINVTIKQLTLYIDESMLTYNGSTVSWENVVKAYKETTADTVDLASFTGVTVSYKVTNGSEHDYDVENNKFDANSLAVIAQLTLQAIPSDTVNFKMSGVELEMVYAVTFAASTTPEVAENVVKVFNNQPVADPKTQVEGYRLAGWYLPEAEDAYKFDTLVTGNITLTAKWVKLITITWYAEDGTTVLKTLTADIDTTATYIDDTHTAPTKDATTYIDYAFNKWVAMNEAATEYALESVFTLTEDINVKASFTGKIARMTVKYVVVYGNGTAADAVEIGIVNVGKTVSEIGLPELAKYTWFTASAWMNGETEFTVVEADALDDGDHTITLTATYVFAIGNGDVDGNGEVGVADITLYRQVIVGGYDITTVENAWETATAEGFAYVQGKFYLAAAADVDEDSKTDIRDVSTIRMALVGGYGYTVDEATNSVVKGTNANSLNSARSAAPKQVLAPMGLFGKKFAL